MSWVENQADTHVSMLTCPKDFCMRMCNSVEIRPCSERQYGVRVVTQVRGDGSVALNSSERGIHIYTQSNIHGLCRDGGEPHLSGKSTTRGGSSIAVGRAATHPCKRGST
jgi:hypothetical protein